VWRNHNKSGLTMVNGKKDERDVVVLVYVKCRKENEISPY